MHKYTVALRFESEVLDPNKITSILNLQPREVFFTRKRNKFDATAPNQIWDFNGFHEVGFQFEWDSLQEGLEFLFKWLNLKKEEVAELAKEYEGYWWCGHFQSSFNGGPHLTADFLAELASYKIPFYLDNYFSSDEEEDSVE